MKKIISLVLALAMIMMVGAVYADGEAALPTATISITNMGAGDQVTLYKIIKWDANKVDAAGKPAPDWAFNGITVTGYDTVKALVDALNGSDAPAAMTALAAAVSSAQQVGSVVTLDGTTYSSTQEVGSYLALVKGANGTVYNPMVLSVNFDYSTNPAGGLNGTIDADTKVTGTSTVAKKQPVTLTKEVNTDAEGYSDITSPADQKKGIAVGDTIPFIVRTVTPNYGTNYTDPVFTITDTLSDGIEFTETQYNAIVVKNHGTALTKGTDYTITDFNKSTYTITFSKTYLQNVKANTDVTVEYTATVNKKAVMHNVEQYDNDVDIVFSNSPTTTDDSLHDETHHYTFSIDASLLGSEGGNEVTKELVKIGVDELTGEVITKWETKDASEWSKINPLKGATFTLTRSDGKVYNATSDANGYLNFTGLDAASYTLVETSAPAGYKFSTAGVPVVITAEYNTDDTLKEYSITINDNATSTYTATNNGGWTTKTTINDEADTTGIINEKGVTLPSTGGIGTTIFYILGGLLVVGAAVILIARRKAQD